jgi:branched-chain amino acid transport system substrate-binding protein
VRRWTSCLTLATAALVLTACTSGSTDDERPAEADFSPAAAPAVAVPLREELPGPVQVGVVVTGAGARGEGAEYAPLAAGARVAEFRLDTPEADAVALTVVDDRGTSDGAIAATRQLVDAGVSGIVYASSGPHLDAALEVAAGARTAVLLPYEGRDEIAAATAWRTGPSDEQVTRQVRSLLAERGRRAPLVLTADGTGTGLAGLADPARRAELTAGDGLSGQVAAAAGALTAGSADAVVVAASADTAAETVAALQGLAPGLPVVLGPSALAPAFSARLTDLGSSGTATTAGQFLTVGPAATDSSTSEGVVRFLAAVRLAAQDGDLPALSGTDVFGASGAATADVRSHDAVLSLVAAASAAGSVEPAAVLDALQALEVGAEDGLAGPALDFGDAQALPDDGLSLLQATTRGIDRGVAQEAPALSWFALPAGAR